MATNEGILPQNQPKLTIIPSGIKRHQHDLNCEDSGCEEIINLRYKNGSWRTVGEKTVLWEYDHACRDLYYHAEINETGTAVYIGYCSGDHKVYLIDTATSSKSALKQLSFSPFEVFQHFSSLKNILIVTTSLNVYYFKWDDNTLTYLELSKDICPDVQFGYSYRDFINIEPATLEEGGLQTQAALFDKILIEKYKMRQKGMFCHSWVVMQWAYRMWDGSYIMHSQPSLVKMGNDDAYYYRQTTGDPEDNNYGCELECGIPVFNIKAPTGMLGVDSRLEKWKGLITHLCIFMTQDISKYLLEYNPTHYKTDEIAEYYTFGDNTDSLHQLMNMYPYYLAKEVKVEDVIDCNEDDQFEVNINELLNKLNYDGNCKESMDDAEMIPVRHNTYSWKRLGLSAEGVIFNILTGGLATGGSLKSAEDNWNKVWYTNEKAEQTVETTDDAGSFILQAQPELPVDDFSHHTVIPSIKPYAFNAKLHFGDITVKFGNGHQYSRWGIPTDFGPECYEYNNPSNWTFHREIKLETDRGTRYVYEAFDPYLVKFTLPGYDPVWLLRIPNIVSYPDVRATRLRIIITVDGNPNYYLAASYSLKSHKIYNFAYAVTNEHNDAGTEPGYLEFDAETITITNVVDDFATRVAEPEDNRYYVDHNRVQVSKINNALVYPAMYSYQFGNSAVEILAFGTQSAPISLGQFGQFPLTVFTSQGVFLLQQGNGQVIYSAIMALNNDVIFKNSVCELGGAMVYACSDGIKLLSGNKVQHLSREVEGQPSDKLINDAYYINFITDPNGHLVNLYQYLSEENFLDYLDDNVRVVYDKINKEIIVTNRDLFTNEGRMSHSPYSYVYNLQYKTWHKITDSWHDFMLIDSRWVGLKNHRVSYPNGFKAQEINVETPALQDCMIQSRPMKWGSYDFKKMKTVIQRSLCYVGDPIDSSPDADDKFGLYMFASLENNLWKFVKGIKVSQTAGMIQSPSLPSLHASVRNIALLCAVKSKDLVLSHWEVLREITMPGSLGAEARQNTERLLGSYDEEQYGESYDIGSSTEYLP